MDSESVDPVYWLEISVRCDGEAAEAVSAALEPFAYQGGVVIERTGDQNPVGVKTTEPDLVVKIYIPGHDDNPGHRRKIEEVLYYLGRLYPIPGPLFRKLEDKDWGVAWREHFKPFQLSENIWIRPSWISELPEKDQGMVITLDPGMAFGTGLHPSTRMCVEILEKLVVQGNSVLDVGTGTGILAIAAARLGAEYVLALDTDAVAVRTARENTTLNRVSDKIRTVQGSLDAVGQSSWDIVVVNILAPVIIRLIDGGLLSYLSPNGRLILSGIIDEQEADVRATISRRGGSIVQSARIGDWVALVAKKKRRT